MFGYVIANKQELKLREYDEYQSYYCGLCRMLKKRSGRLGQLTLSYDMAFLVLLLTGLYEPDTSLKDCRCAVHPLRRHPLRSNKFTEYAADMNLLLFYYKCLDDWADEKKKSRYLAAKALHGKMRRVAERYPEKAALIKDKLSELSGYEAAGERDPDRLSGCFGELMAELFVMRKDIWEKHLRRFGFYLGKFIYLLDAYEDVERDRASGSVNPLAALYDSADYEDKALTLLNMMMAECAAEFEYLPILENAEILRNILYSGVWSRYESVRQKKAEKVKKNGKIKTVTEKETGKEAIEDERSL